MLAMVCRVTYHAVMHSALSDRILRHHFLRYQNCWLSMTQTNLFLFFLSFLHILQTEAQTVSVCTQYICLEARQGIPLGKREGLLHLLEDRDSVSFNSNYKPMYCHYKICEFLKFRVSLLYHNSLCVQPFIFSHPITPVGFGCKRN